MAVRPYIPEFITVHLGAPDSSAQNVTITFAEYIENVASGEIYPTWPEESLKANIYAQISFALNKIYLEFYRSQGYNFDITGSTAFDQSYVQGRNVFENISDLVYDIFDTYIRRDDAIEPLAAAFCNGTTTTCDGLSQWGTVDLANQGLDALSILRTYYGNDIVLNEDTPTMGFTESYPGRALRLGDNERAVYDIHYMLNLISTHYPVIPKVTPPSYEYDEKLENAVRVFQETFNLTVDGITGRQTWYRMVYLFVGIKELTELHSQGLSLEGTPAGEYLTANTEQTKSISRLQYYLKVIGVFYTTIPPVDITNVYDAQTQNAVLAFQKQFGLDETGEVTEEIYDYIYRAYITLAPYVDEFSLGSEVIGDYVMERGSVGENVRLLQRELNFVMGSDIFETGIFGDLTKKTLAEFQRTVSQTPTGRFDSGLSSLLWTEYLIRVTSINPKKYQYPGYDLVKGMSDQELQRLRQTITTPVKDLQTSLREVGFLVIPDGFFGDGTETQIKKLQKSNGIEETGKATYQVYRLIDKLRRGR